MIWDKLDFYWQRNYLAACEYYREHRNLNVPSNYVDKNYVDKNYVDKNGVRLGSWLSYERQARSGKRTRGLPPTQEQIERLDKIGMIWGNALDYKWEQGFAEAKAYYEANGNLRVPQGYKTATGFNLGSWIQRQRVCYKKIRGEISSDKIERLESIVMVWQFDKWMTCYNAVLEYYKEFGTIAISQNYSKDGIWPEKWLMPQPTPFEKGYVKALAYYEKHGHMNFGTNAQTEDGFWIGAWAEKIRKKKDLLTAEQIGMLDDIGFVWEQSDGWEEKYQIAEEHYRQNGTLPLEPKQCRNSD